MVAHRATIPGTAPPWERLLDCQSWRHDVVMLLASDGGRREGYRYSAYGVPFGIPRADINGDGEVDLGDFNQYAVANGNGVGDPGYNIRADINLDGEVDLDENGIISTDFGATLGRGALSQVTTSGSGGVRNRIGYAGYQYDDAAAKYHVRNRIYDAVGGRWLRRDPLGYVDGPSLYEYVGSRAMVATDSSGLFGYMECNPENGCSGIQPLPLRDWIPAEFDDLWLWGCKCETPWRRTGNSRVKHLDRNEECIAPPRAQAQPNQWCENEYDCVTQEEEQCSGFYRISLKRCTRERWVDVATNRCQCTGSLSYKGSFQHFYPICTCVSPDIDASRFRW